MLQQIVTHTPLYVWLLLAFLVARGVAASRDRVLPLRRAFILPIVLMALSVQDIATRFGIGGLPAIGWVAGLAGAALLAWRFAAPVTLDRAAGTVRLPGSWLPLALMLATFAIRYAVAVACAMHPALAGDTQFALAACTLYGVLSGLFLGPVLRCVPRGAAHMKAVS